MIASEIVTQRKQSNVDCHPRRAAIVSMLRPVVTSMLVGVHRAMIQINDLPLSPATMGFESAGIAPILLFGINLALGAAVGAIVGLVIGVVGAILWPHQDAKSSSMLGPESLS
jgi:hypothetical protein